MGGGGGGGGAERLGERGGSEGLRDCMCMGPGMGWGVYVCVCMGGVGGLKTCRPW